MFTSTWYIIAPLLLFVLFTFLTITGLSSFYSLNPCFAAIFLSINIPVVPLSKSAFTIMPSCVSTFSTPMFNHISLNILNVLLMSLCLSFSFVVPFGTSVCALSCCAFPSLESTATSFLFFCFEHLYHLAFSNFLSLRTSYPLLFFLCIPFFSYHLHSM